MELTQFTATRTGRLVPIAGVPDASHAFVPDPLPPAWDWPASLWQLLLDAREALARLDGTGKHLPNPNLLLRPLQNREALRSSSLEGTVTDPRQQALFAIEPSFPETGDDPRNALREVFNYATALRLRLDPSDQLPLSLRVIRTLHSTLMDGVRGSDRSPGEFRRLQNQVGKPPRYVPPPVTHLEATLHALEKYLHANHQFDPLVESFLVHYQFEAIHPFQDGNGRVGRLLLAITIAEWCRLSNQWLYMSAFFDRYKDRYADLLLRVSTHGDWHAWIEFCLRGVVEQARDTQTRCERLLSLSHDFHGRLRKLGGSGRLAAIVADLFIEPVTTVTHVRNRLGVSYPTARADLKKLAAAEIVEELDSASQISYYSRQIFAVTYDEPGETPPG